jgi:hypothetical protein
MTFNSKRPTLGDDRREYPRKVPREPGTNPGGSVPKGEGWKTPVGIVAKMFMLIYASDQIGDNGTLLADRRWSDFGVTRKSLARMLDEKLPECREEWIARGKSDKTFAGNCYSRLYNMFYQRTKGGRKRRMNSTEHPEQSARFDPIRKWAQWAFRRDRPTTRDEILEAWGQL